MHLNKLQSSNVLMSLQLEFRVVNCSEDHWSWSTHMATYVLVVCTAKDHRQQAVHNCGRGASGKRINDTHKHQKHDLSMKFCLYMCTHGSSLAEEVIGICLAIWLRTSLTTYMVWLIVDSNNWTSLCAMKRQYVVLLAQACPMMINHLTSSSLWW